MTLPLLDAHTATVEAPRPVVWEAVRRYAASLAESDHGLLGRALGTVPASGFALDGATEGQEVALTGRHRFARYRLVFVLRDATGDATDLTVQSFADFRGLYGRVYRGLLIGTRGHVLAVRRMLRTITQDATLIR
jgi:hypothetical protein